MTRSASSDDRPPATAHGDSNLPSSPDCRSSSSSFLDYEEPPYYRPLIRTPKTGSLGLIRTTVIHNSDGRAPLVFDTYSLSTPSPQYPPPIDVQPMHTKVHHLPVELLQKIFMYAVRPSDRRGIFAISHVCFIWRLTIHELRQLYTYANWNRWPEWLLELWCERARGLPLLIHLGSEAVDRIGTMLLLRKRESGYLSLLTRTKPSWKALVINYRRIPVQLSGAPLYERPDPIIQQIDGFVFGERPLPWLRRLRVVGPKGDGDILKLPGGEDLPLLCHILVDNRIPQPRDDRPSHHLHRLALRFPMRFDYDWNTWTPILSRQYAASLKRLRLDDLQLYHLDGHPVASLGAPRLMLGNLEELSLGPIAAIALMSLLDSLDAPSLTHVNLEAVLSESDTVRMLCKSMYRAAPHITSISVDVGCTSLNQARAKSWLDAITRDKTAFPGLRDVRIGFRASKSPTSSTRSGISSEVEAQRAFESSAINLARLRRLRFFGLPRRSRLCRQELEGLVEQLEELTT